MLQRWESFSQELRARKVSGQRGQDDNALPSWRFWKGVINSQQWRAEAGKHGRDQAQSPTITSGARCWRSSEAHTGPLCRLPAVFLRRASLDLEEGDSSMGPALKERISGEDSSFSSCCCSSHSSLSASCRFMATACPAKNVRSWALPPLEKEHRNVMTAWLIVWYSQSKLMLLEFINGSPTPPIYVE